ncbi:MAG: immune inhibitor A [Crocinitomix sp.]|nr:immune inhibitor A [Crocinitomix sp.]
MKNTLTIVLIAFLPFVAFNQLQYAKVKIYATNAQLYEIGNLGVTIDHGQHKSNEWFITDLSQLEIQKLIDNGVPHEILIEDVATYYALHSGDASPKSDRVECPDGISSGMEIVTPSNFHLGSMGGYYTYEAYLTELDEMRAAFPDLITEKTGISDFLTWESRPIHWVRISDNADSDEAEKEVLYTAIHHAREPMSLSQTIFYMWYLLENYGTNAEVTFLVDHTEMYFVPMINPDGYKRNQTTNPGGGGMHRKNRNPGIGTSNKGVDLNRNYDYHWNETGTSPDEDGDTYAGTSAFSEPETQAIKWFCENHDFLFAFNAHSHGDLLLYPFGWSTGAMAADNDYFDAYSHKMSMFNNYTAQKSSALYEASGDSDDWMYDADLDAKPKVYAMTPEIGDAFWPPSSAIIPTCKEMWWSNLLLSHLTHVYGLTEDLEINQIETEVGYFSYNLQRFGIEDGDLTISITPLVGITTVGGENVHSLDLLEEVEDSISYDLVADIAFGDEIKYILHTSNGDWTRNDTIVKTFGAGELVFTDACDDLTNWIGDWNITDEIFYSASNCITDSPFDPTYSNNLNKSVELNQTFSLEHATYAYVNFYAQWEIENDYDYVQFMISTDEGGSWTPLCGNYTNTGVDPQDVGEPLYDGNQTSWVFEEVNLIDYLEEPNVRFKFRLITDEGVQADGFYFDDFSLSTDGDGTSDIGFIEFSEESIKIYPNPANEFIRIKTADQDEVVLIEVYDEIGQLVKSVYENPSFISTTDLSDGIYFVRLTNSSNESVTKRFSIVR